MSEEAPSIEVLPIDLTPYSAGNIGIPYVHRLDSGRAGPRALICALTHGNELCGALALDWLMRRDPRPLRGSLTLAFMNVDAYRTFDPAQPSASRFLDEDMNRLWAPEVLDGRRRSRELARARVLRPVVDAADRLLDLHSMQLEGPPLTLCGTAPQGRALAMAVGQPRHVVADPGHRAGPRMRDYGGFGRPGDARAALLVECGQHWRRATVDVAIDVCLRFLRALGLVDAGFADGRATDPVPPPIVIEVDGPVTIESDRFRFTAPWQGMEVVPRAGTVIGFDGDRPVATPFDDCVLIMPSRRLVRGQTAVRLGRIVG